MAAAIGFDETSAEEITIAVSELASNLARHAGGGTVTLTPLAGPAGIRIESLNSDSGISYPGRAMANGFSTAGSLGYGLGAVNRFMDDLEITPEPGAAGGVCVVGRRWVRGRAEGAIPCPLAFGVATRPRLNSSANGDAFVVKRWGERALVGVIDGLGHGPQAHLAAETARQYVESHYDQPLEALFRGAAHACSATRGVVMALARFDWALARLTFASVGNVEARVFRSPAPMDFLVQRGVIGLGAPTPRVTEHPWKPDNVMVLHSDGLATHWKWEDYPDLPMEPATAIARRLLGALARDDDDATVLVVRDGLP